MWSIICEFMLFWGRCLKQGFHFAWETFGVFDLACAGVAGLLYLLKKSHQQKWEEKWEPRVRRTVFIIFVATLVVSVFGIAPFLQMRDAVEKTRTTPAIAKHDVPYESLANQLAEATTRADTETKRAKQEHEKLENEQKRSNDYQVKYIEALSATNTSPNSDTVREEIAILQHEQSLISPTNSDYYHLIFQNKRMMGLLEAKDAHLREVETLKNRCTPIYPLLVMAFTTLQTKLDGCAKKCGGEVSHVDFPTLDDIIDKGRQTLNITIGTNFAWSCRCVVIAVESQTSLDLLFQGRKAPPAELAFWVRPLTDPQLRVALKSEEVIIISTNCLIASKSDCVKMVNDAVEVSMQGQQVEFETTGE